jgi:hypothetical protein
MAQERIEWYDERSLSEFTDVFKAIRAAHLPEWLRVECEPKRIPRANKASMFADTGRPFRGDNFL